VIAGILYLTFLLLWGFNYQRQPFRRLGRSRGAPVQRRRAGRPLRRSRGGSERRPGRAAGRRGRGDAPPDGPRHALLRTEAGFGAAAERHAFLAVGCARPKPLLASAALSWLGLTGIYSPFTGEPNVNMTVPNPELPFAASHEVAHQRGFAREDEANYLAISRAAPSRPGLPLLGPAGGQRLCHELPRLADRAAWQRIEAGRSAGVRATWPPSWPGPRATAGPRSASPPASTTPTCAAGSGGGSGELRPRRGPPAGGAAGDSARLTYNRPVCGRFTLTASGEELAEAFGLDDPPELAPRYNIAPTQPVAVVRAAASGSGRTLSLLRWGLLPARPPSPSGRSSTRGPRPPRACRRSARLSHGAVA